VFVACHLLWLWCVCAKHAGRLYCYRQSWRWCRATQTRGCCCENVFLNVNKIETKVHSQISLQEKHHNFKSLHLYWGCWVYYSNSGQITPNSILFLRFKCRFFSVKHIQFIVKNTFKATCFGSTEPCRAETCRLECVFNNKLNVFD